MLTVNAEDVMIAANELDCADKIRSAIVDISLLKREFDMQKEHYDEVVEGIIAEASKSVAKRFTDKERKGIKKAGEALAKDKISDLYRDTETLSRVIRNYFES